MNRFVRLVVAATLVVATGSAGLVSPSSAARPQEIFPTKNSTYEGGETDNYGVAASVKIKIAADNHVAKRVKLKMTCADGTFKKTLKNYEILHSVVFEMTDEFEVRGEWQNKRTLDVMFTTSSASKACPGEYFEFTASK